METCNLRDDNSIARGQAELILLMISNEIAYLAIRQPDSRSYVQHQILQVIVAEITNKFHTHMLELRQQYHNQKKSVVTETNAIVTCLFGNSQPGPRHHLQIEVVSVHPQLQGYRIAHQVTLQATVQRCS